MRHEAAVAVAAKATSAWWQVAGDGGPFLTVNIFIIMGESIKYKHQQLLSTLNNQPLSPFSLFSSLYYVFHLPDTRSGAQGPGSEDLLSLLGDTIRPSCQ